jgi:nucleoside-diphosphate-sugar epimerase
VRVLVTGGTGLVGRHVIQALLASGYPVTALARSDQAAAAVTELGAEPVRGDLRDVDAIRDAVRGVEAIVHAGAVVLSRRDWAHFHATNVESTLRLARCAAREAARLVHISSVAVYGRRTTYDGGAASVSEEFGLDRPLFPGDHYARSKREAELAVWRVARETGLSAVALRPCVIYGEGDRNFSVRVARALRRRIAPIVGDGSNPLSVVYAGNVAAAVIAAIERPEVTGAFNVANDGSITQRAFVERFAEGMGVRLRMVRVPRSLAWGAAVAADSLRRALTPGSPMMLLKTAVQFLSNANPFTSNKAERELGWRPVVQPEEAARRTGRWFAER